VVAESAAGREEIETGLSPSSTPPHSKNSNLLHALEGSSGALGRARGVNTRFDVFVAGLRAFWMLAAHGGAGGFGSSSTGSSSSPSSSRWVVGAVRDALIRLVDEVPCMGFLFKWLFDWLNFEYFVIDIFVVFHHLLLLSQNGDDGDDDDDDTNRAALG
jgi:hypothetical protein